MNRPHPAAAIHSAASAAGSLARRGAAAAPVGAPLPPPITSCIWVGPSLLFTDADGGVWQILLATSCDAI